MTLAKQDLLAALRLRYDHYSAGAIFETTIERAGLPDQVVYDAAQIVAFRGVLARVGDRLANVNARLDALLGTAPMTAEAAELASAAFAPAAPAAPDVAEIGVTTQQPDDRTNVDAAVLAPSRPRADEPARPAPASDVATIGAAELASGAFAPGIHETAAPPRVKTTIIVTGVDTADDEQVLVCGGLATLGDWEPANALAMQRDGAIWAATIEVPPGAEASFKFLRRSADGTVTWETGEDRRLVAKPRIEATWR